MAKRGMTIEIDNAQRSRLRALLEYMNGIEIEVEGRPPLTTVEDLVVQVVEAGLQRAEKGMKDNDYPGVLAIRLEAAKRAQDKGTDRHDEEIAMHKERIASGEQLDLVGPSFKLTRTGDARLTRILGVLHAKETAVGDKLTPRDEFLAGMLETGVGFFEVEKGLGLTPHESQALARPLPDIPGLVDVENPDATTDEELRTFIAWVDDRMADARKLGRDAVGIIGAKSVQIAGSYEAITKRGIPCAFEVLLKLEEHNGRQIAQVHIREKQAE